VAAEDVRLELGLNASVLAAALFTVPLAVGAALETVVLLATEGRDRRKLVALALAAMALGQVVTAMAPGAITLTLAITAWGIASGVATSGAEAELMTPAPGREADGDRVMARWALLGALGDLCAPALFALLAYVGLGWRGALAFGAGVALLNAAAVLVGRASVPATPEEDEEEEVGWREALADALRNRELLAWLFAAACCTFFDEILVAFGALHLRAAGLDPVRQGLVLGAFPVGGAVGLAIVERMAWPARRVLLTCAAATTALWLAWIVAGGTPAATGILGILSFALGAFAAPMWPLATARAYASGARPGVVAAMDQLFVPIEVAAPLVAGVVADRMGLAAALVVLLVQPLVIALVSIARSPGGSARPPRPSGPPP
jgi:predicted MFS family arabinose efflux permease